jgi:hypothetical protein
MVGHSEKGPSSLLPISRLHVNLRATGTIAEVVLVFQELSTNPRRPARAAERARLEVLFGLGKEMGKVKNFKKLAPKKK